MVLESIKQKEKQADNHEAESEPKPELSIGSPHTSELREPDGNGGGRILGPKRMRTPEEHGSPNQFIRAGRGSWTLKQQSRSLCGPSANMVVSLVVL